MKVIKVIASEIRTNSYLLLTKKPVIIDPSENAKIVLNNLKKHIKTEDLEYIILTHFHADHTIATPIIKKETNAKVLIHELDAEFLGFKPDRTLKEDEILNLGDCKLKVIHTPGHTPGSICLYEEKSKSLFSGDTIFPDGGVGRTDLIGGNTQQLIESIKHLCKLDVKVLYPGHGEVTDKNVNGQIKRSLELVQE
ncbi:MAG: MBL fold metallo-hydrolase [Candidatus Aenigmarchaeota archaeon]|nr:MBL fold metallo-hydrolase [Candidatus Aenigmarchaeota archaeon]